MPRVCARCDGQFFARARVVQTSTQARMLVYMTAPSLVRHVVKPLAASPLGTARRPQDAGRRPAASARGSAQGPAVAPSGAGRGLPPGNPLGAIRHSGSTWHATSISQAKRTVLFTGHSTLFGALGLCRTLSLVVKERGEVFTRQGLNRVRVKAAFGERVRGVMRFSLALVTM